MRGGLRPSQNERLLQDLRADPPSTTNASVRIAYHMTDRPRVLSSKQEQEYEVYAGLFTRRVNMAQRPTNMVDPCCRADAVLLGEACNNVYTRQSKNETREMRQDILHFCRCAQPTKKPF
jgi:hypothetical protein